MGTNRATRARIAAMAAAEAAIEQNARDPYAELEQASATAAQAISADPETVLRLADEIVVKVFQGRPDRPGSLRFLCVSCGDAVPRYRLVCERCAAELLSGTGQ